MTVYEGSRKMTSEELIREDIKNLKGRYDAPNIAWPSELDRAVRPIERLVIWLAERELARTPPISCTDFNIPPSVSPQALSAYVQTMEAYVGGPTGDIRADHGLE